MKRSEFVATSTGVAGYHRSRRPDRLRRPDRQSATWRIRATEFRSMARDDEPISGTAVDIATVDQQLEEIALAIERAAIARNAANYEIGQRLRQARDLHFRKPDGGFKGWVERRLGWTEQYAHRFIHAVESLRADETQLFSLLSASAFFAVARAPVEVRVQVAGLIESGAKMTAAAIKEM